MRLSIDLLTVEHHITDTILKNILQNDVQLYHNYITYVVNKDRVERFNDVN